MDRWNEFRSLWTRPWIGLGIALLALALPFDSAHGATIGKMAKGIVFLKLTKAESDSVGPGSQVLISTDAGKEFTGEVLSKVGRKARVKIVGGAKGLKANMKVTIASADAPGEAPAADTREAVGQVQAALGFSRSPASPSNVFFSGQSGEGLDLPTDVLVVGVGVQFYFIFAESFEIGPELAYLSQSNKGEIKTEGADEATEIEIKRSEQQFGFIMRYAFMERKSHGWRPYVGLGFGVWSASVTFGADADPDKLSTQYLRLPLGVLYNFTPTLAFEGALDYRQDTVKSSSVATATDPTTGEPVSASIEGNQKITTTGIRYGLTFYF